MGDSCIIAIDFGTAYSGYAYTVASKEKQIDPFLKKWGKEHGYDTPKTPTCILLNEHGEFLKFGYDAKTTYMNLRGEEAKTNYFFQNFKMDLYNTVRAISFCTDCLCLQLFFTLKPIVSQKPQIDREK